MARPSISLAGQRFDRLVVVSRVAVDGGRAKWLCRCDCGNERVVFAHNLLHGGATSCGCRKGRNKTATEFRNDAVTKPRFSEEAAQDLARAMGYR